MKGLGFAVAVSTLVGCATLAPSRHATEADWERTMHYARLNVDAGNYFAADHVLDEFVRTHSGTQEAREIMFWRAAYLVDPANERGSLDLGIAALDNYLADSVGLYKAEATVLRRTAAAAKNLTVFRAAPTPTVDTVAGAAATVTDTVVVVRRSRDEEIAALREQLAKNKDELAKVSAELERIKKRLANPSR